MAKICEIGKIEINASHRFRNVAPIVPYLECPPLLPVVSKKSKLGFVPNWSRASNFFKR